MENSLISPMAYVHPDAKIGANVKIDPFAYVAADVVVGDDCHIRTGAVLQDGARLGKGCDIHTGAVIAGIPQDLKAIVKDEDVQFLSESAFADACCPGNPRDTSVEEIAALYRSLM